MEGAPSKPQMQERRVWDMEEETDHVGGPKEHCQSMQGCNEKGQDSLGIVSGKGHQGQQEGLLQIVQQQKEG